jgi:hypothetical protein
LSLSLNPSNLGSFNMELDYETIVVGVFIVGVIILGIMLGINEENESSDSDTDTNP